MKVCGLDYDGTIINIEPQKARVFGEIAQKYWDVDKQEAANYWIEKGGTSRRHKFDYFYKKQFNKNLSNSAYKEVEQEFSSILKNNYYPKVKLLPGVLKTIQFIRANFDFVFITSGITMEEIRYLVKLNSLSAYFDLVLGTNERYLSKRDHFKEVIEHTEPELMVFIADGLEDMRIAKEFNIICIGIPTNHSSHKLEEAGATYVCELGEVKLIIKKLLSNVI